MSTPAAPDQGEDGPRVGVVVVSYGSSALLRTNLTALVPGPRRHVVVVDNHSTDAERRAVAALAAEHGWELVASPNRGFGAGMNAGAARAQQRGCDVLVLLNPDVVVGPEVVDALARTAAQERALVAPRVRHPDGSPAVTLGSLDLRRGLTRTRGPLDPSHARWLSGACLAVGVPLWRAVGGFAEDYFMYWEDLELSARCLAEGGRLVVRDDLVAVHAVGGTQGEGKSALYRYYNCRNRLLYASRMLAPADARRWLGSTPRYARAVLLRDGRRAVLRHPAATLLPVLRGTWAGVRTVLGAARPGGGRPSGA